MLNKIQYSALERILKNLYIFWCLRQYWGSDKQIVDDFGWVISKGKPKTQPILQR